MAVSDFGADLACRYSEMLYQEQQSHEATADCLRASGRVRAQLDAKNRRLRLELRIFALIASIQTALLIWRWAR